MKELTQEYLKQCLDYNPETGIFTWKERPREHFKSLLGCNSWNTKYSNKQAGNLSKSGYIQILLGGKLYKAHRIIWFLVHGYFPDRIDHKNGIKYDNRISNLRECTHQQNVHNQRRPQSNNTTGFLGVSKVGKKFQSRIILNGNFIHLGVFKTPEEAHECYLKAKRELHSFCTI